MKIVRRIFTVMVLLLAVFAAVLVIAFKSGFLTSYARDIVEAELLKATGKNIRIEKIELGFVNNISVLGVSVPAGRTLTQSGEFAHIKAVIFRFNIIDIFLKRQNIEKTLSHIIIESPVIYVTKKNNVFNVSDFVESLKKAPSPPSATAGAQLPIPLNKILIENGAVVYKDEDRSFASGLNSIKGTISLSQKNNNIKVFVSGKTAGSDRKNVTASYEQQLKTGNFSTKINVKNEKISSWFGYIDNSGKVTATAGEFDISISASGHEFDPAKMQIKGALTLRNGNILVKDGPVFENVTADALVENTNVELKDLSFILYGGRGVIKGNMEDIFNTRKYTALMALTDIKGEKINSGLLTGNMRVAVNVRGDINSNRIEGGYFWDNGSFKTATVKDIQAKFLFEKNRLTVQTLQGIIGGGVLKGSGGADLAGAKKISFKAGLTGASTAKLLGSDDFKGALDMEFNAGGTIDTPNAKAVIRTNSVFYKGSEIRNLKGVFDLKKGSVKITGNTIFDYGKYTGLSLDTDVGITPDKITINNINLKSGKMRLLNVSGFYGLNDKKLDIYSAFTGLVLSKLDIEYLKGKDIDGVFNSAITFKGTSDLPEISAIVKMDDLKIKGEKYTVDGELLYGNNILKISRLNFNNNLTGDANFSLKKKIFEINASVKSLNGDAIKELSGINAFGGCVINGTVNVKKETAGYGGNVDLNAVYAAGVYRRIEIKAGGQNNDFDIEKIYAGQKSGSMTASGSCLIKNDTDVALHLKGNLKNFYINDALSADCDFAHSTIVTLNDDALETFSRFKADNVNLNGKKSDTLDVLVKTRGKNVNDMRLSWGDAYSASGRFYYGNGDKPFVELNVKLKDADLYPIFRLAGKKRDGLPEGSLLKGNIKISGEADSASLTAEIMQGQSQVKLNGTVQIKKKGLKYEAGNITAKYELVNAYIDKLGKIADPKFSQKGRANGSGELKGTLDNPEASGELMIFDGLIAGLPFEDVSMKYSLKNKKVSLDQFKLNYRSTSLDLSGSSLEFLDNDAVMANITARSSNYKLNGNKTNGTVNISGKFVTGDNPLFEGNVVSDNFTFKNHNFKPIGLKINYSKDGLVFNSIKGAYKINGDVKFLEKSTLINNLEITGPAGKETVTGSGSIQNETGDSDLTIDGKGVDPQIADDLLGWGHKWAGEVSGNCKISGNVKNGLAYTIQLKVENGSVDGVDFDLGSAIVAVKDNWVDLSPVDPITVTKIGKYEVHIGGKIPAPSTDEAAAKMRGVPMDLKVTMKDGDLSILKFLKFIDDAQGPADLNIRITGTKEFPSVNGKLDITDGTIKLKYLFKELKHVYANLLVHDNVIDIYDLKGDTERGTIKVSNLEEKNGGMMKFMNINTFNWRITNIGDKIRITDTPYLEFIKGDADVDIAVTGPVDGPLIKGTVKVSDFTYQYPVKSKDKSGAEVKVNEADNPIKKITWDLDIYGGDNVKFFSSYQTNYADVTLDMGTKPLKLQDRGNDMKMTGVVKIKKGTYKYLNTEFNVDAVKESKVLFDGTLKPMLDVFATVDLKHILIVDSLSRELRPMDLTVNLHLYGRVGDIKMDMSCVPPLGMNEYNRLLYIVSFGKDMDPQTPLTSDDLKRVADSIAGFWLKKGGEQLKQWTPFDIIDIKANPSELIKQPASAGPVSATNTAATVFEVGLGKYLTDRLYVNYNLKLLDPANTINQQMGMGFEQQVGFEYSLDDVNKLKVYKAFSDPYLGTNELYMGIESRWQFGSWGWDQREKSKLQPATGK
jgi:autotransporter translocation and assembly factor TamB